MAAVSKFLPTSHAASPEALGAKHHAAVLIGAVTLLLVARLLPVPRDGMIGTLPSICPFKNLSTLPCAGCGLTRSVVLCAHGDWAQAFNYHPLGVVFYLSLWVALGLGLIGLRVPLRPLSQRLLLVMGIACAAVFIGLWIVRLTGIFPYPPAI